MSKPTRRTHDVAWSIYNPCLLSLVRTLTSGHALSRRTWTAQGEAAPIDCCARNLHCGLGNVALEVLQALEKRSRLCQDRAAADSRATKVKVKSSAHNLVLAMVVGEHAPLGTSWCMILHAITGLALSFSATSPPPGARGFQLSAKRPTAMGRASRRFIVACRHSSQPVLASRLVVHCHLPLARFIQHPESFDYACSKRTRRDT